MHLFFVFTTLLGALAPIIAAQTPTAKTQNGIVVGTTTVVSGIAVNEFLGIPYAAKPERFAMPSPHPAWETRTAQAFGDSCIQSFSKSMLVRFSYRRG
jgi:carboxylesterase type B